MPSTVDINRKPFANAPTFISPTANLCTDSNIAATRVPARPRVRCDRRNMLNPIFFLSLLASPSPALADTLQSVIDQYQLNAASYNLSFPSTTLNSDAAVAWVVQNWSPVVNHLDWGDSNV